MTQYVYTGGHPRVLLGLSQGVNAQHFPASGDPSELVDGQTVVIEPGDSLRTDEPYEHAELEAVPDEEEPKPRKRRASTPDNSEGVAN